MPRVRKTKKGLALKRWFKEDWKDVRTGKACGRRKGEKRGTPYCRPRSGYPVKPLKQPEKCPPLKRSPGSHRKNVLDNPQENQEE